MARRAKLKKRKLRWVEAGDLHAGAVIVVDEGNIRHYYRVCEYQKHGHKVMIVYKDATGFERFQCADDDLIRTRIRA